MATHQWGRLDGPQCRLQQWFYHLTAAAFHEPAQILKVCLKFPQLEHLTSSLTISWRIASAVSTGAASGWKLRQVRKASQQKLRVKVVMRSQNRALLMGNLPSPAFTFFKEYDEVGRREAPSLAAIITGLSEWFAQLDQTKPSWKLRYKNRFDTTRILPSNNWFAQYN